MWTSQNSLLNKATNELIRKASQLKSPKRHIIAFECPDCEDIPRRPVTGSCGHSRCSDCASNRPCPCCEDDTKTFHHAPDVLVRSLVERWFKNQLEYAREADHVKKLIEQDNKDVALQKCSAAIERGSHNHRLIGLRASLYISLKKWRLAELDINMLLKERPLSHEGHYLRGITLLLRGAYNEALISFTTAIVLGRDILATKPIILQTLVKLCTPNRRHRSTLRYLLHETKDISMLQYDIKQRYEIYTALRRIIRDVKRYVTCCLNTKECRKQLWPEITAAELECVLCCRVLLRPVTTPCGHTYCRDCLERCFDYGRACPLCVSPLHGFFSDGGPRDSVFASAAVASLSPEFVVQPDDRTERLLPVFVCTAAFPSVSCPLFIFEPRYRLMVRRCLESGARRFGIAACTEPKSSGRYVDYGTVLEIRDCVRMADGKSILSTIGVSRFRVIARGQIDGYDVARVEVIKDRTCLSTELNHLRVAVRKKALMWLEAMDRVSREKIEQTFGEIPAEEPEGKFSYDGPAWTWWLLAILPLATRIKVMILATEELVKRLRAIDRTLDFICYVTRTKENGFSTKYEGSIRSELRSARWLLRDPTTHSNRDHRITRNFTFSNENLSSNEI